MSTKQVSRRAVARGIAWTVPVAAVSVAAPAFAFSDPGPSAVLDTLCACGGRQYRIQVTFTNAVATTFDLSALSVAIGNQTGLAVNPTTASVSAGPGTTVLSFSFTRSNNGGFTQVSFTYTATNTSTSQASAPQTITLTTASAPACTNPTC
ncbi:MAG: hypothetical protein ABIO16_15190 [Nocardioides sp.]